MKQFYMDRIGVAVTRNGRMALSACILVTIASVLLLANGLQFNGNVSDVLKADTTEYLSMRAIEQRFHPFSTDEILIVESEDLGDPDVFAALEDLVFEMQLVDGIDAVVSIFTLRGGGDETGPFMATRQAGQLAPRDRLNRLLEENPLAQNMLSKDRTTTLLVLMVSQTAEFAETALSDRSVAEIRSIIGEFSPALTVRFAGIAEIHRAIENALREDQIKLAFISTLFCGLLSLAIFRSWRGSVICGVPPMVGVVWFFGFVALTGTTIDTVTSVIPTLLVVVGFADSVHLYYSLLRAGRAGLTGNEAVQAAMSETAPACFLTSLTTAFACLGIGLTGSATLNDFALMGFAGMIIEFTAVIIMVPILARALGLRDGTPFKDRAFRFSMIGAAATACLRFRWSLIAVSIGLLILFVLAQFKLEAGFSLIEHLQDGGQLRQMETRLENKSLASGRILVVIDDADGKAGFAPEDAERVSRVARAVFPEMTPDLSTGLFPSSAQIDRLAQEKPTLLRRYVADDGLSYLLPVPVNLASGSTRIIASAQAVRERIDAAGLGGQTEIVGLSLLSAIEVPRMIADLRAGFYVALVLIACIMFYATGSISLGVLSLIPNLIPVLGVEAWLWFSGQQLSMTAAVALTIAFGIAVDNSIHFLNRYQHVRIDGIEHPIHRAIRDTVSPMTASTLLLVVGLSVTQASSLPTVAIFGQLVAAALTLALFANLFLMPAFLEQFVEKGRK
jgi:hypothetical protein